MSLLKPLVRFARDAFGAGRFEYLFALTERELAQRGLDRQRLVRGYVSGLGAF